MNKIDYKKLQIIQENTTKKLIQYINDFVKRDTIQSSIEFYYPDFDEQKTKIAFNVWISIDYKTVYGKSFIEHMLEDKASSLSSMEKKILIERNKSFISLFEIKKIEGNNIHVLDLLTNEQSIIWDQGTSSMLKPSDLIFGRIGKIIDYKGFLGNISLLPSSVKGLFLEEVFIDYNRERLRSPDLSIKEYLKAFSLNVYRIYTECLYEIMDTDEDITDILYDELDEFENYLKYYLSKVQIKKHITNLINLFEFYMMEEEFTLYDIDQVDIELFFKSAIRDGFISTQKEMNSYIYTLKEYINFLKSKDYRYKKAFRSILKISRDRFLYLGSIKYKRIQFPVNRNIADNLIDNLNEDAFSFLMDYEKFLLYIMNNPLKVTKKRRYIARKHLLELNNMMNYGELITKKAPNQEDFPLLHLFYSFSIHNDLLKITKEHLYIANNRSNFLRFDDEEKYALFLQYIWMECTSSCSDKYLKPDMLHLIKKKLLKLLINLQTDKWYISKDLSSNNQINELFQNIYVYFEIIGLLEYRYDSNISININPFGKLVFNILLNKNTPLQHSGKIIYLNN